MISPRAAFQTVAGVDHHAVGDRGCLTLSSSVGSTTYCAVLDRTAFSAGEGEIVVDLEPRSSDAAVADILVNLNVAGQTQLAEFVSWPAPGAGTRTLRASGPADPGDPVGFFATTSEFDGGQIVIDGELPAVISIDEVNVVGCAAPPSLGEGTTTFFEADVENSNPDIEALADIGWFVDGLLVAEESSVRIDAGATRTVSSAALSWSELTSQVGTGTVDVDAEVLTVL